VSTYSVLLTVLLVIWFVASVIAQDLRSRIWRFDWFDLLPNCHFFAPKPVSHDVALFIRSHNPEIGPSNWRPILSPRKRGWCFIWNPEHRLRKSLFEMVQVLQENAKNTAVCHLSYAYLVFLSLASHRLRSSPRVQFLVTAFEGHESCVQKLVFISHVHRCKV
jgi:hypothetical protein